MLPLYVIMYGMSLASDFVRGFGSVVDLSGRSLASEHLSTEALFDQLFGPTPSTDIADKDRFASRPEQIRNEIAQVAGLYQFAMTMIADTSEAMDFALMQIPEQQREDILPALFEVRRQGISAIIADLEARAAGLVRNQRQGQEEVARLVETLRSRTKQ